MLILNPRVVCVEKIRKTCVKTAPLKSAGDKDPVYLEKIIQIEVVGMNLSKLTGCWERHNPQISVLLRNVATLNFLFRAYKTSWASMLQQPDCQSAVRTFTI